MIKNILSVIHIFLLIVCIVIAFGLSAIMWYYQREWYMTLNIAAIWQAIKFGIVELLFIAFAAGLFKLVSHD